MRLYRLRFLCGDARRRSLEIGLKFGLQVTSIGNGHDFLAVEGRIVFIFTQVDGLSHDTLAEIIFHEGALKSFISKIEMNGIAVCRTSGDGRESVTISCPVGNLQFTFAQCSDHCCQCVKSPVSEKYIQVDHITVAVDPGTSTSVLEWFEKCLNFKRFRINSVETDEGLSMFTADTGLNLLALQYRHCSEVGLQHPLTSEDSCDVKFVIAEPLSGSGPNQVATFLQQHRGPGVQHIGLLTTNIFKAMDQLRTTGVDFIQPPTEYYELVSKLQDIESVGESVRGLQTRGILLDTGADAEKNSSNQRRYLMQSFTKPLFDQDTFFIEIIQRCGATGFGTGNIKALWEALALHMERISTAV